MQVCLVIIVSSRHHCLAK